MLSEIKEKYTAASESSASAAAADVVAATAVADEENIHVFAREGSLEKLQEVLVRNPDLLDHVSDQGMTPLHDASCFGQAQVVKYLISMNANMAAVTTTGFTCLHVAATYGHFILIEILIRQAGCNIDALNAERQTALHVASKAGNLKSVVSLLKGKADAKLEDSNGRSAV